jgi:CpXC protein
MPPVQTQISCPNCRQPVRVAVEQLFDLYQDPSAKDRLLGGSVNFIQCPHCGFQGELATPIVYHDPKKEMLLTYVPVSLGLPQAEQERTIGALINQVSNNLPQEMRKGYLLNPQTMLTYEGMTERILEADGITKEMIQAQQEKVRLLQRLMNASADSRPEIIAQEDDVLDAEFFGLLSRLIQGSAASGDEESAKKLSDLQEVLLAQSTFGKEMQGQIDEIQAAANTLRELGDELTREKLLDLLIDAPNETRVRSYVSLVRQGLDYEFFQILTQRIDSAQGEERDKLTQLRADLLEMTNEIDKQIETKLSQSRDLLTSIVQSHSIPDAVVQNLSSIDQFFLDVLNQEIERSRNQGDMEKLEKYRQVMTVLESISQPPEIELVEELLNAPDDQAREVLIRDRSEEITPEFVQVVTGLLNQAQSGGNQELHEELRKIHRMAVRHTMQSSLQGN